MVATAFSLRAFAKCAECGRGYTLSQFSMLNIIPGPHDPIGQCACGGVVTPENASKKLTAAEIAEIKAKHDTAWAAGVVATTRVANDNGYSLDAAKAHARAAREALSAESLSRAKDEADRRSERERTKSAERSDMIKRLEEIGSGRAMGKALAALRAKLGIEENASLKEADVVRAAARSFSEHWARVAAAPTIEPDDVVIAVLEQEPTMLDLCAAFGIDRASVAQMRGGRR